MIARVEFMLEEIKTKRRLFVKELVHSIEDVCWLLILHVERLRVDTHYTMHFLTFHSFILTFISDILQFEV